MTHRLSFLVAMLCLSGVSGCSSKSTPAVDSNQPTNQTASAPDTPQVALIMKSLANEFFATMAAGAEAHQKSNADSYSLIVNGIKDERDLARQVSLVDEMVAAGVDAIVIAPADSKALVPVLRRAQSAGIVIVNIDNRLDPEVMEKEGVRIPFVGPDNRAGAKQVGDYLATRLEKGSPVLVVEGIRTSDNGNQRRKGFEDAMQEAGMSIVDSQSAEWETAKANSIVSSMLSEHPEAKAVLAANDSMALGAMAAAKSAGRDDLFIVGFDNISAIQQAIREGKVLATADQHGDQLAVYGIETALKILSEKDAAVEDVQTPVDLVTAEKL